MDEGGDTIDVGVGARRSGVKWLAIIRAAVAEQFTEVSTAI